MGAWIRFGEWWEMSGSEKISRAKKIAATASAMKNPNNLANRSIPKTSAPGREWQEIEAGSRVAGSAAAPGLLGLCGLVGGAIRNA